MTARIANVPAPVYYVVALTAFLLPMVFKEVQYAGIVMNVSTIFSAVWSVAVIMGFWQRDQRMPRILLLLPCAVFWPVLGLLASAVCQFGGDCL